MQNSVIKFTVKDRVATIILNRPQVHNALNLIMVNSFLKILQELNDDASIRLIILQGTGKNFCAGADLNWMKQAVTTWQADDDSIALKLSTLMYTLYHINKPTIALVQGNVVGGGAGLVCCCDIVLAAPDCQFHFSEVRLGLIPAVISPYVIKAIGARFARRYFLSAEIISVNKALGLGLIHEILPQKKWPAYTLKLSTNLKAAAPYALARTKQLINDVSHRPLDNNLLYKTAGYLIEAQSSIEAQEGVNAFFENRPASWINSDQESS